MGSSPAATLFHIHDLVDFVSAEAMVAGRSAGQYVAGTPAPRQRSYGPADVATACRTHLDRREHAVYLRAQKPLDMHSIRPSRRFPVMRAALCLPAEMVNLKLRPAILQTSTVRSCVQHCRSERQKGSNPMSVEERSTQRT